MRATTRASLAGAAMLGGVLLAGCGGGGSTGGSSSQTADVVVHGNDALRFDKTSYTARAGSVSIELIDDGTEPHTLLFDGSTVDWKKIAVNRKGAKATGTVTLQPGTYTIYCDIPGHRGAGMEAKLVVN